MAGVPPDLLRERSLSSFSPVCAGLPVLRKMMGLSKKCKDDYNDKAHGNG